MMKTNKETPNNNGSETKEPTKLIPDERPKEIGGPKGLEPTRYGDWESKGICSDF